MGTKELWILLPAQLCYCSCAYK